MVFNALFSTFEKQHLIEVYDRMARSKPGASKPGSVPEPVEAEPPRVWPLAVEQKGSGAPRPARGVAQRIRRAGF